MSVSPINRQPSHLPQVIRKSPLHSKSPPTNHFNGSSVTSNHHLKLPPAAIGNQYMKINENHTPNSNNGNMNVMMGTRKSDSSSYNNKQFQKTAKIYGGAGASVTKDTTHSQKQTQSKQNISFKQLYSTKDFAVVERIIKKAEKSKQIQKKRCASASNSITLSEIIEAYKKVMMKKGIEILNETHYYAMIIKLSLNQHGKTWRQCLEHEKKKNKMKRLAIQHHKYLSIKKFFCKWIENYIRTYRSMQIKSQNSQSRQQSPIFINSSDRLMMSTIKHQDQTPLSSKSIPFGEITNKHINNFNGFQGATNKQSNQSDKQLLFTQPTAQETEFIKNIINLSGQKTMIAQTTQPQTNANYNGHHNFSLTGFSQNLFATNFGTSQGNLLQNQDFMMIEPSSNQLRSLERSYQLRKKERALFNIGKVMSKQQKLTTFSEQNIGFITEKAFKKWAFIAKAMTQVIQTKEDFINKWMLAFEHHTHKRQTQVFQALKNIGLKIRVLEDRELKLRCQFENKLIESTFFSWIDKLNRRVNYRKQLYRAINHWSNKINQKTFFKWKIYLAQQKDNKYKFRNFKMINYIKSFLQLGVPRDIQTQDLTFADQLQTLVEIRKLKAINQSEIDEASYLYDMQIKAAIFDQIKQHYQKMSDFKALQMIRLCYKTIVSWKGYTQNNVWLREKQEEFLSNSIYRQYKKLLQTWQQYSHQRLILKNRIFCSNQKNQFKLLDKSMHILKNFYHNKIESYKMNQTARQFHFQNLYVKSLVSLEHNRRLSKAQKVYLEDKNSQLYKFHLNRTFQGLKSIVKHLKFTREKGTCLRNLLDLQNRKDIFLAWLQTAFNLKRAIRFRFVNLSKKAIEIFRMGLQAQRYLEDAMIRGKKLRKMCLKRKFISFIREGLIDIKLQKEQRKHQLELAYINKLARIFKGFVLYRQEKIVKREQAQICDKICITKQKQYVYKALKRHALIQKQIKIIRNIKTLKFKKQYLDYLRYSTSQSFELKNNYYDFLVDKSRLKATLILTFWHSKTIQRSYRRSTLQQRTEYFMKRRYFRNHNRKMSIKSYYDQKLRIFELYKYKQTQFNVLQGFLMNMNSKQHKNDKKARLHYLTQLLVKSISTFKRFTWLGKAQACVEDLSKFNKIRNMFSIWSTVFMNSKVSEEAVQFMRRKKAQKVLKEWQEVVQQEQRNRLQEQMASFQYENSLRLRLIQLLKYNITQKDQIRAEYRMKDVKAYWLRLQRAFSRWKKFKEFKKQLYHKQSVLQTYLNQKHLQTYFNNMKITYRGQVIIKSLKCGNNSKIQVKYFSQWRENCLYNRLQRQKCQETDIYSNEKILKKYFQKLKGFTVLKKDKHFKSMQCTIYYFRRLLKTFIQSLRSYTLRNKHCALVHQQLTISHKQRLLNYCFNHWHKQNKYQKIETGSLIYLKRKSFLRFQRQLKAQKLEKLVSQNKELKVIELLVYKLQKRAFFGMKAFTQFAGYKKKMQVIERDFKVRRWFEKWRQAFVNCAQDNYLNINDASSIVSFKASENKVQLQNKYGKINIQKTALKNKENSKSPISIKQHNKSYMSGGGFLGNKLNFINI